ncbi:MAG: FHA domain-containing protein [Propionibacteriaceae bacterium]|jgi:S-DNA-T family DNA segregation ATPase FtsK/SpoIIIE|nr:FHA domain-containing protein [Propionibacteriaceae bacterium]
MKLKLSLVSPEQQVTPIAVTAESTATIGEVGAAIQAGLVGHATDSLWTLSVSDATVAAPTILPWRAALAESGLRSGQNVQLYPLFRDPSGQVADVSSTTTSPATLRVVVGPDAGKSFELRFGPNTIGRDPECDIQFSDPMVSRRHARISVGDAIEIWDTNSANGVVLDGHVVPNATLGRQDTVMIGDNQIRVERHIQATAGASVSNGAIEFNRSPKVRVKYTGRKLAAPKPPAPPKNNKFPLVAMVAPLIMGGVMFAVTRNMMSIIFVALSPLIALGTWFDKVVTDRRALKALAETYSTELDALKTDLDEAMTAEVATRRAELPPLDMLLSAASDLQPDLWQRRPADPDFLDIRLGLGQAPSRNVVELPARDESRSTEWRELSELAQGAAVVSGVPVAAKLRECGNLGIAGTAQWLHPVARGIITQLACLHSPAELVLAAIASTQSSKTWEWLMWLPHVGSAHSPIGGSHLAAGPAVPMLVSALEEVMVSRLGQRDRKALHIPALVLLVEDDAPIERGRLVALAERGPEVGVHLIWVAGSEQRLPSQCRTYLTHDQASGAVTAGFPDEGIVLRVDEVEGIPEDTALSLAKRLAPVLDAGAPVIDQSDIPRAVSYLALAEPNLALDPTVTLNRWREDGSLPGADGRYPKVSPTLRGLVGQGAHGGFLLDLRTQGPHALVGGTTGAGKSEFLQSWILGMAAAHSPSRVTFLLVDYKGGAAFADCVKLPHTVGLVTDLSPHLVRRALTSLRAELWYREQLLNAKKAKDLVALERTGDPECPPSLVIVVDEFAALVHEVPEFVDGVVDVAQRGRSLGLHLILATQRPAGVIKDNLRANTNLRVALRMADEADSQDVIGLKLAAEFDPRVPGRAAVRTGPGRITLFQTGYAGGHTSNEPEPASVEVETMVFGSGNAWDIPKVSRRNKADDESEPTDIARAITTISAAAGLAGIPEPRKPWLPELSTAFDLRRLRSLFPDASGVGKPIGVVDLPQRQAQSISYYDPDAGHLAVYGTSGSGKSAVLRTIAVASSAMYDTDPAIVYGIDCGTAGLTMLTPLPNVGAIIGVADTERVDRVFRHLIALLEERASRFAAVNAGSIADYRKTTGIAEQRVFLLIDGYAAFRSAFELVYGVSPATMLSRLLDEGRALGIHVVLGCEQPNAIPNSQASNIQRRLILRQAEDNAYGALDIPKDSLNAESPAGRGVFSGTTNEVQIAVPGGSPNPADQALVVNTLAERLRAAGMPDATPVRRLTTVVTSDEVPHEMNGLPVLGIESRSLEPIGFDPHGAFMVAGMPGSGRTTALRWLAQSLRRWDPEMPMYFFGPGRSMVRNEAAWSDLAINIDDMKSLAAFLKPKLEVLADARPGLVLLVEGLQELLGTPVEQDLLDLVKLAKRNGHFIIGEGETSSWSAAWQLVSEVRSSRRGVVLQPDSEDGDFLFRVQLPRMKRADFPVGRGVYVEGGKPYIVQLPLPD